MPIFEVVLRESKAAGITCVTMTVGCPSELLQTFFDDSMCVGHRIDYFFEERQVGTVELLTLIPSPADETEFLMMDGGRRTHHDGLLTCHRRVRETT